MIFSQKKSLNTLKYIATRQFIFLFIFSIISFPSNGFEFCDKNSIETTKENLLYIEGLNNNTVNSHFNSKYNKEISFFISKNSKDNNFDKFFNNIKNISKQKTSLIFVDSRKEYNIFIVFPTVYDNGIVLEEDRNVLARDIFRNFMSYYSADEISAAPLKKAAEAISDRIIHLIKDQKGMNLYQFSVKNNDDNSTIGIIAAPFYINRGVSYLNLNINIMSIIDINFVIGMKDSIVNDKTKGIFTNSDINYIVLMRNIEKYADWRREFSKMNEECQK